MIVVTTETLPGREVSESLGLVRGNTVRARHIGRDIMAGLRNIVGGEVDEYTKLLADSREQAIDRMVEQAVALDADAILATRFITSALAQGAAEIVAYGTAGKTGSIIQTNAPGGAFRRTQRFEGFCDGWFQRTWPAPGQPGAAF